jgi:hypothetical protein
MVAESRVGAPRDRSCARRERGDRRSFRALALTGSGCARSNAHSGPIPLPPWSQGRGKVSCVRTSRGFGLSCWAGFRAWQRGGMGIIVVTMRRCSVIQIRKYPPPIYRVCFWVLFFWWAVSLGGQVDARRIAAWGDSLTAADYPKIFAGKTGMEVVNGGVNGQTSSQIAARMLAAPHLHRCPTILWAGRNNYDQPQTVLRDLESMVSALALAGNTNQFLVLGVINSSYGGYEDRGTLPHRLILDLNRELSVRYGERFVPVREILIDAHDPNHAGDAADHAHDVPPGSLRSDVSAGGQNQPVKGGPKPASV